LPAGRIGEDRPYNGATAQPSSLHVQVASSAQAMTHSPPGHGPIVQLSPALHSSVQPPPAQSSMSRVEAPVSGPVALPLGPM
jgi:hypothetical protein